MIPLLADKSVAVTVAPLTITVPPTVKDRGLPFTVDADIQSVTFAAGTAPATTW